MRYSACVLVINKEGSALAVSRKHDVNDFGLPGGKADPDETPEQCAIRECLEETGYTVKLLDVKPFVKIDQSPGCSEFEVTTFLAEIDGSVPRQEVDPSETGRVAWIDPMRLIQGYFEIYNDSMLRHFGIAKRYEIVYSKNYMGRKNSAFITNKTKSEALMEFVRYMKGQCVVHAIHDYVV